MGPGSVCYPTPRETYERKARYWRRHNRKRRRLHRRRVYCRQWRQNHPLYFVERRRSLGAAPRQPKQATPPPSEVAPLFPHLHHGVRIAFWNEELAMDLEQEWALALLEGRDPEASVAEYRARETAFARLTCTLSEDLY